MFDLPETSDAARAVRKQVLERMKGVTPGKWEYWTSCSWRRFRNDAHKIVCEPYVARDGQPDLQIKEADAQLIVLAPETNQFLADLLEQHAQALEAQRWIPVEERLPELSSETVIVFIPYYGVTTAFHDGTDWQILEDAGYYNITHWQPLPAPPAQAEAPQP